MVWPLICPATPTVGDVLAILTAFTAGCKRGSALRSATLHPRQFIKIFAMTKLLEWITLYTSDDPVENWRYKDGKYKTQSVRENTHGNPHNNRDKYCEPKSCNLILLISFFIFLLSQSLSFFLAKAKFVYRPLCRIE